MRKIASCRHRFIDPKWHGDLVRFLRHGAKGSRNSQGLGIAGSSEEIELPASCAG